MKPSLEQVQEWRSQAIEYADEATDQPLSWVNIANMKYAELAAQWGAEQAQQGQLTVIDPDAWEPCTPSYLHRGGSCHAPRVWDAATCNHWHPKLDAQAQQTEQPKIYTFHMHDANGDDFSYAVRANSEKKARSIAERACDEATTGKLLSVEVQQITAELPKGKSVSCKCSVCEEWQQSTESGMVCKNGHGGVIGVNVRTYTAAQMQAFADAKVRAALATQQTTEEPELPEAVAWGVSATAKDGNNWMQSGIRLDRAAAESDAAMYLKSCNPVVVPLFTTTQMHDHYAAGVRAGMGQQSQDANEEVVTITVPLSHINSLQVESIKRLVARTKHAHMTDVRIRINGNYEYFEADWLKYVVIGGGA